MLFRGSRTPTPAAERAGGQSTAPQAVHPYPGPQAAYDPTTGTAIIGVHTDGSPARWPLYTPGHGMRSGLILGATSSGTTMLAAQIGITAAGTGHIVAWPADPDGAGDLHTYLDRYPHGALTGRDLATQLRDTLALIERRQTMLGRSHRATHVPTSDAPALLLIVEDTLGGLFAAPSSPFTTAALRIAREGRKAAVGLLLTASNPGATTLHPRLLDTLSDSALAVLRLPGDPISRPPGTGSCTNPSAGRPTPFRGWYLPRQAAGQHLAGAPRLYLPTQTGR
ncbi:hypothetical protein [Frankia sp. AgB32]|uniref:hypothetical protein n=1 Tax=Frankia sp. AgB32 TaxID=631119 RepID=UPI0020104AB6|nr:hypothetical protein [Frankia sp. AgB32]MCK9895200.1 hypothetical protein [Frankia sp. AgB32]